MPKRLKRVYGFGGLHFATFSCYRRLPVWSRKKRAEKLGCMHVNPAKRGLVEDPKDWRWSSYSFYQGRGAVLVEMDPVE